MKISLWTLHKLFYQIKFSNKSILTDTKTLQILENNIGFSKIIKNLDVNFYKKKEDIIYFV